MPYRTRVRRLRSSPSSLPETARLDLPTYLDRQPQSTISGYQPSPDDVMAGRSWIKWTDRLYKMFQAAVGAGSDAMIPVIGQAYEQMVAGYNAVEEALKLYKMGVESYDYYKAKVREFVRNNPDVPPPPLDVDSSPPPSNPTRPTERPGTSGQDPSPQNPYPSGGSQGNGAWTRPWRNRYMGGPVQYYTGVSGGMGTYPGKFPPGYRPGGGARASGGRRKHDYVVSYTYS